MNDRVQNEQMSMDAVSLCDVFMISMYRCWSQDPDERPSMDEVVSEMNDLLVFFPGGGEPLVFPISDSDSIPSSGASSCYDLSATDRYTTCTVHKYRASVQ